MSKDDDVTNRNGEETIDWRALSAGEIYDRFTKKGAKLGT